MIRATVPNGKCAGRSKTEQSLNANDWELHRSPEQRFRSSSQTFVLT
jgi:hypothetical protein